MDISYMQDKDRSQEKQCGNVFELFGEVCMISFDNDSQFYRIVNLSTGLIFSDKYASIDELWKENGDASLVDYAELVVNY